MATPTVCQGATRASGPVRTRVALGGIGVALGGIGVAVAGIGVAVAGIGVAVAGIEVAVGGMAGLLASVPTACETVDR
ncbi:hypothetical protein ACPXCG_03050 [Gordonia sp. DT218]